jgi:hypothetical protein
LCVTKFYIEGINDRDDEQLGILQLDTICICKTRLCGTKFYVEGMNDRDDEQLGFCNLIQSI